MEHNFSFSYCFRKVGYLLKPKNSLHWLIVLNMTSFLLSSSLGIIFYFCGYKESMRSIYDAWSFPSWYALIAARPWTLITYSFVNENKWRLLLSICRLYVFGRGLQSVVHTKHVGYLYGLGQVVGAWVFWLSYRYFTVCKVNLSYLAGASTATYAIMVAACVLNPDLKSLSRIAMYISLILVFIGLFNGNPGLSLAKLSSACIGYGYARFLKWKIINSKSLHFSRS